MKIKRKWVLCFICLGIVLAGGYGFSWNTKKEEPRNQEQPVKGEEDSNEGPKGEGLALPGPEEPMVFPKMMESLSRSMYLWNTLEPMDKIKAVDAAITYFALKENSAIRRPHLFYVLKIDDHLAHHPDAVELDIISLVKILAVMDYDFLNGQNKEELAKEVLGDKLYQRNKLRFKIAG